MSLSKLDLKKKRIREFFSTFNFKSENKCKEVDEARDEFLREGLTYIQMRMPVEKITKEFEEALKTKIEHNIIHANIREVDKHEATRRDLVSVMDMYNHAWLTSNTPFRPITVESLKLLFNDPDIEILIAKVYGTDVAFVILDYERENKEYGIIAGLGVVPRYQRRGIGLIIGMAAWNHFKEKGVKELRCEVYKDNQVSYSFIKSLGFEEFGSKTYRKDDFLEDDIE